MQQVLQEIGDNYCILEDEINVFILNGYFKVSKRMKNDERLYNRFLAISDMLFSDKTPLSRKRVILVALANSPELKNHDLIKRYNELRESGMMEWGVLAQQESALVMEEVLCGVKRVMISSGLGGKSDKLRYCLALKCKHESVEPYQSDLVKGEAEFLLGEEGGILEDFVEEEGYFIMRMLIPIHLHVRELLSELLRRINVFGDFIRRDTLMTNLTNLNIEEVKGVYESRDKEEEE